MKQFNTLIVTVICIFSLQVVQAQLCSGTKGPNLLGAKGTFSEPYITVNTNADACLADGLHPYSPVGNIGNAITKCSDIHGEIIPCSDYDYTDKNRGMVPEFTYTLIKNMGDPGGKTSCIHEVNSSWVASDHTGDGGYFLAVNGAPNDRTSPLFYQIKQIPVCIGTTYEFSAWVISMAPGVDGTTNDASPNISFQVNGVTIGTSGKIPYNRTGKWIQVGGSFIATTNFVDLEVLNATSVASGNDLGLDDISIRVCQSQIMVAGDNPIASGTSPMPIFTVTDPLMENTWYKWQLSTDGGSNFYDETFGDEAIFNTISKQYKITPGDILGEVSPDMNGFMYRLIVSTSKPGLETPKCIYVGQYRLIVEPKAGGLPITLTSFEGTYSKGTANLKWQTSQEINSDRFELLKSANGRDFELITTMAAAGTSSTVKNYQYQDRVGNTSEIVYYKLKQIDKDGKFTFSSVVKLKATEVEASFQIYPNPVLNSFTASFSAPKATSATMLIRNIAGQSVFSKTLQVAKGNNSFVINNAQLKTGMYYVTIIGEDINYNGKLKKQ